MDAEKYFIFDTNNSESIKELLMSFKAEQFSNNEVSNLKILDILTNVLIEAMQYAKLIPHALENEIEELTSAIDSYESIKNSFIEFIAKVK